MTIIERTHFGAPYDSGIVFGNLSSPISLEGGHVKNLNIINTVSFGCFQPDHKSPNDFGIVWLETVETYKFSGRSHLTAIALPKIIGARREWTNAYP
jgi:hypothetical protein